MFSREEMESIPMSQLVFMAGADWEIEDDVSIRLEAINSRLKDLDRLLSVTTSPSLVLEFNQLTREKNQLIK